jgi:hypothetical protein
VEQILDEGTRDDVHGLVVMTGSARFQDTRPENVVDLASLVPHIEQWQEQVLSRQQVHLYVGRLECTRRQITRQTDVEHQAYLQRKFGESR